MTNSVDASGSKPKGRLGQPRIDEAKAAEEAAEEAKAKEAESLEASSGSTKPETAPESTNESRTQAAAKREQNTSGSGQNKETLLTQIVRGYTPEAEPQTQATALLTHLKKQTSEDTTNDVYSDYNEGGSSESTQRANPALQLVQTQQNYRQNSTQAQQAVRQLSNEQKQKIIDLSEALIRLGKPEEVTQALKDLFLQPQKAQEILSNLEETKNQADIEAFEVQAQEIEDKYQGEYEKFQEKDSKLYQQAVITNTASRERNKAYAKDDRILPSLWGKTKEQETADQEYNNAENKRQQLQNELNKFFSSEDFQNTTRQHIEFARRQEEITRLIEQGNLEGASAVARGESYTSQQEISLSDLDIGTVTQLEQNQNFAEEQRSVLDYKEQLDQDILKRQKELRSLIANAESSTSVVLQISNLENRNDVLTRTIELRKEIAEKTRELEARQQAQEKLTELIDSGDYEAANKLISGEEKLSLEEKYNTEFEDRKSIDKKPSESTQELLLQSREQIEARQKTLDAAQAALTKSTNLYESTLEKIKYYQRTLDGYEQEAMYMDYNNFDLSYTAEDVRRAEEGLQGQYNLLTETGVEQKQRDQRQDVSKLSEKQRTESYRLQEAQALFDLGEVEKAQAVLEGESVEIQSEIKISVDLNEYRVTNEELASFRLSDEEYQKQIPSEEESAQMSFDELKAAGQLMLKNQAFRQLSPEARQAKIAELDAFRQKPQNEQDAILYRQAITDSVTQLQQQIKQIQEQQDSLYRQKGDTELAQRQEQIGANEKLSSQLTRVLTDFQALQARLTELAEGGDYDEMNKYRTGEKSIEVTRSFANQNASYLALREEVKLTTEEQLKEIETLTQFLDDKQASLERFKTAMEKGAIKDIKDFLELDIMTAATLNAFDLLADFESDILKNIKTQKELARVTGIVLRALENEKPEIQKLIAEGKIDEARQKLKGLYTFSSNEYNSRNSTAQKFFSAQEGELERNIDTVLETGRKFGIMVVATGVTIATAGTSAPLTMPLIYGTFAGTAFGFGSEVLMSQTDSNKTFTDGYNSALEKLPGDFLLALQSAGSPAAALKATRGLEALVKLQQAGRLGTQSKFASSIANVLAKTSPATRNILIGGTAGGSSASVGMLKDSFEVAYQRIELANKVKEANPNASPEELQQLTQQAYKDHMLDMESIIKRNYYAFLSGVASGGLGRFAGGFNEKLKSNLSKVALVAGEETANITIAIAELLAQGVDPNSEQFASMLLTNVVQAGLTKFSSKITDTQEKSRRSMPDLSGESNSASARTNTHITEPVIDSEQNKKATTVLEVDRKTNERVATISYDSEASQNNQRISTEENLHARENIIDPGTIDLETGKAPMDLAEYKARRALREAVAQQAADAKVAREAGGSVSEAKTSHSQKIKDINAAITAGKFDDAIKLAKEAQYIDDQYLGQYKADYDHNTNPDNSTLRQTSFSIEDKHEGLAKSLENILVKQETPNLDDVQKILENPDLLSYTNEDQLEKLNVLLEFAAEYGVDTKKIKTQIKLLGKLNNEIDLSYKGQNQSEFQAVLQDRIKNGDDEAITLIDNAISDMSALTTGEEPSVVTKTKLEYARLNQESRAEVDRLFPNTSDIKDKYNLGTTIENIKRLDQGKGASNQANTFFNDLDQLRRNGIDIKSRLIEASRKASGKSLEAARRNFLGPMAEARTLVNHLNDTNITNIRTERRDLLSDAIIDSNGNRILDAQDISSGERNIQIGEFTLNLQADGRYQVDHNNKKITVNNGVNGSSRSNLEFDPTTNKFMAGGKEATVYFDGEGFSAREFDATYDHAIDGPQLTEIKASEGTAIYDKGSSSDDIKKQKQFHVNMAYAKALGINPSWTIGKPQAEISFSPEQKRFYQARIQEASDIYGVKLKIFDNNHNDITHKLE